MLVAYQGILRDAFVDPSTGSSTARSRRSEAPSLKPDSSLKTPRPASVRMRTATESATRSERYCPGRVPANPQSARSRSEPATPSAASPRISSKSAPSTAPNRSVAARARPLA